MNFFNFKRKHWVLVGIFTGAMFLMVIGFTFFIERQAQKAIAEVRGRLIPEPFQASSHEGGTSEEKETSFGLLSVQVGGVHQDRSCSTCMQNKQVDPAVKNSF